MLYHSKFDTVTLPGGKMEYIRFGTGTRNLIMLPGLGESLQRLKGTQDAMALLYRIFAKTHTVWIFGRKIPLESRCTTKTMARDQKQAMERLGIEKADVVGVSMGGMIAQHLAADYPEAADRLVLVVTAPCANDRMRESIEEWIRCAENGNHTALMDSNVRRIYSGRYYRQNKWLIPIMGRLTKPKSYDRFFLQARACLSHDARTSLPRISAPTLIIGGEADQVLGGDPSRQLHDGINASRLVMYPDLGHGLYDEAKDFLPGIQAFLSASIEKPRTRISKIKGGKPMLIRGCQEGKATPKLTEVKCPKCGAWVEVFIKLGGAIGETGTLISDETCECGHILPAGSRERDYETE